MARLRDKKREHTRGNQNEDRSSLHRGRQEPLREHSVPQGDLGDQESRRLGGVQARRLHGARAVQPGGGGHPRAEVFPQGRRGAPPEADRGDAGSVVAVALGRRRAGARPSCRRRSGWAARPMRGRCSTGWPARGPTGAGRAATSRPRRTRARSSTSIATCWRGRWRRRTRPQWFNTGLHWAYGIDGPGQGHYYVDHATGELTRSASAYEHPQPHACFIQSVEDDLVGDNGIMDLWVREARLFKYGSGTGSNFSRCAARTRSCRAAGARRA